MTNNTDKAGWGSDWTDLDKTRYFIAVTMSSMSMRLLMYPLHTLKTRQQFLANDEARTKQQKPGTASLKSKPPLPSSSSSTFAQLRTIAQQEGVRGLYRGFALSSGVGVFLTPIYLSTLEISRSFFVSDFVGASPTVASSAAAVASTFTAQVIFVPMDNVTQRMMVHNRRNAAAPATAVGADSTNGGDQQKQKQQQQQTSTTSTRREIAKLWQREGIRGFYRGYIASVAVWGPTGMLFWPTFTNLRGAMTGQVNRVFGLSSSSSSSSTTTTAGEMGIGRIVNFACTPIAACIAGGTASALTTPADVIKTRLQLSSERKVSAPQIAKELYQKDGVGGFFLGMKSRMISSMMMYTLMMSGYDVIKAFATTTTTAAKPDFATITHTP